MDWITGDKFENMGCLKFAPPIAASDDYSKLQNTFFLDKAIIEKPCVVYTHTMYVKQLFDVIKDLNNEFVIVSHNGDVNIDFSPPDNVIKWFSQNVNISHERIESLPIGLENDRWYVDMHKKEKMINKSREIRDIRNTVYINHNIGTNPAERNKPYQLLEGKPWVTSERGTNGHRFDEYIDNIYNHRFVICPRGNGIDTHRTWECLYMGTIPIEKRNLNNLFYTELPITFVDDWEDITEEFLKEEWWRINSRDWDMSMLSFNYWKNKIL